MLRNPSSSDDEQPSNQASIIRNLYDQLSVDEGLAEHARSLPRLQSSSVLNSGLLHHINLTYIIDQTPYTFSLPIFSHLLCNGQTQPAEETIPSSIPKPPNTNQDSYWSQFLKFIYKPGMLFTAGLGGVLISLANIFQVKNANALHNLKSESTFKFFALYLQLEKNKEALNEISKELFSTTYALKKAGFRQPIISKLMNISTVLELPKSHRSILPGLDAHNVQADLFTAANQLQSEKTSPDSNWGFILPIAALGITVLYFLPSLFSSIEKKLRDELSSIFDAIEERLAYNDVTSAHEKLNGLGFSMRTLLYNNFFNNADLRQRYHYLRGTIHVKREQLDVAVSAYISALIASDTEDNKFLILRDLINLKNRLRLETKNKHLVPQYERDIAEFEKMIPKNATHYKLTLFALENKLQSCSTNLLQEKHIEALREFNDIQWEAFFEHAYPGATILYFQLKAVLTLCSELYPEVDSLDSESRFKVAKDNLLTAQRHINKDYPEMRALNKNDIMELFNKLEKKSVPLQAKPTPPLTHRRKTTAPSDANPDPETDSPENNMPKKKITPV